MTVMTRQEDIRDLRILHMTDILKMSRTEVGAALGRSKCSIIGIVHRLKAADSACECKKPENKDGGLKPLWWKK